MQGVLPAVIRLMILCRGTSGIFYIDIGMARLGPVPRGEEVCMVCVPSLCGWTSCDSVQGNQWKF